MCRCSIYFHFHNWSFAIIFAEDNWYIWILPVQIKNFHLLFSSTSLFPYEVCRAHWWYYSLTGLEQPPKTHNNKKPSRLFSTCSLYKRLGQKQVFYNQQHSLWEHTLQSDLPIRGLMSQDLHIWLSAISENSRISPIGVKRENSWLCCVLHKHELSTRQTVDVIFFIYIDDNNEDDDEYDGNSKDVCLMDRHARGQWLKEWCGKMALTASCLNEKSIRKMSLHSKHPLDSMYF